MKVIDLLNMISKGEKVPKKIKYDYNEWEYDEKLKTYYCGTCTLLNKYKYIYLNDEVEIIEEKEIPEKLTPFEAPFLKGDEPDIRFRLIIDQINEIIDYLKSKGE